MSNNKQKKDQGEAIARCLDVAEVFRVDLTSLSGLEALVKGRINIPAFVPLTPNLFVESLGDAH